MRPKLLALMFFVQSFANAQQNLTPQQIDRLADAGKIYGYVKYFHPFLQYKNINWDSAFAANVEDIIKAKDKTDYSRALQKILSCLNDGLTSVMNDYQKNSTYRMQPLTYSINDSILYINMNDAPIDSTFDKLQEALQKLDKVKGAIFDMRKPLGSNYHDIATGGNWFDYISSYFKGEILQTAFRTVYYEGLPGPFGYYSVKFKDGKTSPVTGSAIKEVPIVFVVDNDDQVPQAFNELQNEGKAGIIQDGDRELHPGQSTKFYIQDSVLIRMRTGEGLNPDGSLLVITPNATYLHNENPSIALSKAKQLILNGFVNASTGNKKSTQVLKQTVESNYGYSGTYPTVGFRMLAAAKIFSAIDHFSPNKKIMDKDWEESYRAMISKFIDAKDSTEYRRAVAELYTNINDSHGFITKTTEGFGFSLIPEIHGRGTFMPPILTRVVENRVLVWDIYNDSICTLIGIHKGDVILSIDGMDPMRQIEETRKYQPASTKATQTWVICSYLLFGRQGQVINLKVQGADGKIKNVSMPVVGELQGNPESDGYLLKMYSRNTIPTFKLLTKEIGYVDYTSPLTDNGIDSVITLLKNTKGIVVDMRGYPHIMTGKIDEMFQRKRNAIMAKFTDCSRSSPNVKDLDNNWEFIDVEEIRTAYNKTKYKNVGTAYKGKLIVLIDEVAISWSETNCLDFKSSCDAVFVGSHTAGADGLMTAFNIPGGISLFFSGQNVAFPDGKPLQRVGVQPDIFIRPTIKGVQAGKDEVLDRAIKYLQTAK